MKTRQHQDAILDALTDEELEVLSGKPGLGMFLKGIPAAQLQALADGDPEAQHRFETGYKRWRRDQGL